MRKMKKNKRKSGNEEACSGQPQQDGDGVVDGLTTKRQRIDEGGNVGGKIEIENRAVGSTVDDGDNVHNTVIDVIASGNGIKGSQLQTSCSKKCVLKDTDDQQQKISNASKTFQSQENLFDDDGTKFTYQQSMEYLQEEGTNETSAMDNEKTPNFDLCFDAEVLDGEIQQNKDVDKNEDGVGENAQSENAVASHSNCDHQDSTVKDATEVKEGLKDIGSLFAVNYSHHESTTKDNNKAIVQKHQSNNILSNSTNNDDAMVHCGQKDIATVSNVNNADMDTGSDNNENEKNQSNNVMENKSSDNNEAHKNSNNSLKDIENGSNDAKKDAVIDEFLNSDNYDGLSDSLLSQVNLDEIIKSHSDRIASMSIAGDNGAHALNSVKDGKQNTGGSTTVVNTPAQYKTLQTVTQQAQKNSKITATGHAGTHNNIHVTATPKQAVSSERKGEKRKAEEKTDGDNSSNPCTRHKIFLQNCKEQPENKGVRDGKSEERSGAEKRGKPKSNVRELILLRQQIGEGEQRLHNIRLRKAELMKLKAVADKEVEAKLQQKVNYEENMKQGKKLVETLRMTCFFEKQVADSIKERILINKQVSKLVAEAKAVEKCVCAAVKRHIELDRLTGKK